jgi:hypothetical protein
MGSALDEKDLKVAAVPETKPEKRQPENPEPFERGVYRHYKGGLYIGKYLAIQNEVLDPPITVVVYYSLEKKTHHTRPLGDVRFDSWSDEVFVNGEWRPRFERTKPVAVPDMEMIPEDYHGL